MDDTNSEQSENLDVAETGFSLTNITAAGFSGDKLNVLQAENSEETIRRSLIGYEIGRKIRTLRLKKKIGLVDLGRHTGLSASMLSQLENGKLIPTLPTLARIAMVFDVGMDHFFGQRPKRSLFTITRSNGRIRFPERPDMPAPAFFFECLAFAVQDKSMQAYLAEFPKNDPDAVSEHFHDGAEFVYLMEGALVIHCQEEDHELRAGDCVYFDSSEPHSYCGMSKHPARAIVITTPPRV